MPAFALPDLLALAWFLVAWIVYSIVIEKTAKGRESLNALMNDYRDEWMERLLARDMRMVDAQVTASLQNGTAFFASTTLIAIGGALTLLRASHEIIPVVSMLPFGTPMTPELWDLKMMGLIVIFVYTFFKFAWSYRLFNYFAIMVGAAPPPEEKDTAQAQAFAHRAARLCADAGRHFNRGQRAFFFALGYLGWFLGPVPLALSTLGVVIVMWRRQFNSDARLAFAAERRAGEALPQAIPIKTAIIATIMTPTATTTPVAMRSFHSAPEPEVIVGRRRRRAIDSADDCRMPWMTPLKAPVDAARNANTTPGCANHP